MLFVQGPACQATRRRGDRPQGNFVRALRALISFEWEEGIGALRGSTLMRRLNAGDLESAAAEFPKWNMSGGKVVLGITRRRAAERFIFEGGMLPQALQLAQAIT